MGQGRSQRASLRVWLWLALASGMGVVAMSAGFAWWSNARVNEADFGWTAYKPLNGYESIQIVDPATAYAPTLLLLVLGLLGCVVVASTGAVLVRLRRLSTPNRRALTVTD